MCTRSKFEHFEEVNVTRDVFAGVKPFATMNELNQITHSTPLFTLINHFLVRSSSFVVIYDPRR